LLDAFPSFLLKGVESCKAIIQDRINRDGGKVVMTVKELIYAEIDKIGEESLDELYEIVQHFVQVKSTHYEAGALSKLRRIKIQAPTDFAPNLDLYLSGEKQLAIGPDLP